jgi:surface protein
MSEMFSSDGGCCARSFDQDLSSWNVANVTYCFGFKAGIGTWSLPKPNLPNICLD